MPDRPPLAYVELTNFKGLNTKSIPTNLQGDVLRTCSNADFVRKYGGLSKNKGTSRVLATQYQESAVTLPVSWVGFYKFPDLDGQILRRVLIAAGTTLQLVNTSTGALTELATGRTSGKFAMSAQLDNFLFLTNQDDLLIGSGDELVKYDGHEITNWGVEAPGLTATEVEAYSSTTGWTGTNATILAETTTTFDGTSLKMTQGSSAVAATMIKTLSSTFDGESGEASRVQQYIYISPTSYDNLATSGAAVQLWYSSDTGSVANNMYRFDFRIGELVPGWNRLTCSFTAAPSGNTGTSAGTLVVTAIKTIQVGINAAATNSAVVVYWDKLDTLELGAPTGTFTDDTGSVFTNNATNGVWNYRVTYVTKYGLESNAGPALEMDNRSGTDTYASVALAGIPVSSDGQVIARRIYRTIGNGGSFLRLTTINDNVTTTYTDSTSDGSLGTATPPILASTTLGKDNARPPKCGIVAEWKKTLFLAGDPQNPTKLYFSRDAVGEAFPALNVFDFPERITGIFKSNFGLVVCTETSFWRVTGTNPGFDIEERLSGIGAVARRAVGTTRTLGWAIDLDGMRTFDLVNQTKVSEPIRDKYDALSRTKIDTMHSGHTKKDNAIIQFNPDSSGDFDEAFVYQYWVDDPSQGMWSTLDLPSGFDIQHIQEVEDANGDPKLYAADGDGMLFELYNDDSKDWVMPDGTNQAITTTFKTPAMRWGEAGRQVNGWAGRIHPRWVELQTKGDATTWDITVNMYKGPDSDTPLSTATYTFTVGPDASLQRLSAKDLSPSEWIEISATNSQAGVSSTVEAIRMYFFSKPGQFQVTGDEGDGGNV